jgi:hypothetical protein
MSGLKNVVGATLLSASVLCPHVAEAMEIQMFDDMAIEDQRDYLKFLVDASEKILIAQGQEELAAKVSFLFDVIPPDDRRSVGEGQFYKHLAKQRAFFAGNPNSVLRLTGQVEGALQQTLEENRIRVPHQFGTRLADAARTFWPKRPLRQN